MRKVILFFVLACMVLVMSGSAKALTTSDTQTRDTQNEWFVKSGVDPHPDTTANYLIVGSGAGYHRTSNEDWGWTHQVTFSATPATVLGATLEIRAWDSDNHSLEEHRIYAGGSGGVLLGILDEKTSQTWGTTTFNLDAAALQEILVAGDTGTLDIWMNIVGSDRYVTLESATLTVDYIPAPGAILLGSLGVGFVGWLRKRRTL